MLSVLTCNHVKTMFALIKHCGFSVNSVGDCFMSNYQEVQYFGVMIIPLQKQKYWSC